MLSKAKYPMLNRAARRHPKRALGSATLDKGWAGGGSIILIDRMHKADTRGMCGGRDLTKAQRQYIEETGAQV